MPTQSPQAFADALHAWQPFYALTGGAAATLLGLLFVAISVNVRAVEQGNNGNVRWVASQTLYNLFYIFLLSLLMVAPSASPDTSCGYLTSVGVSGVVLVTFTAIREVPQGTLKRDRSSIRRLAFPLFAYADMLYSASIIRSGNTAALQWLVGALVILVLGGIRGSWDLLFLLGTAETPPRPIESEKAS